jgi:hypothetical protein
LEDAWVAIGNSCYSDIDLSMALEAVDSPKDIFISESTCIERDDHQNRGRKGCHGKDWSCRRVNVEPHRQAKNIRAANRILPRG